MKPTSFNGKAAYCGMCGNSMKYIKTVKNQHARDMKNKLIKVSRVFYGCPKCNTVQAYSMREDGQKGDLASMLDVISPSDTEKRKLMGDWNRINATD